MARRLRLYVFLLSAIGAATFKRPLHYSMGAKCIPSLGRLSQSELVMAKSKAPAASTSKPKASEIKAVLSARDAPSPSDQNLRKAERSDAESRRRAGEKLLASYLKKTGFAFDAYEKRRAQGQTGLRRLLKEQQAAAVKRSASVKKDLRHGVEGRRHAIEGFRSGTLISDFVPAFAVVDTPFIIWPTNGLELIDSQIQPWNNTAKINAQWRGSYGSENLRFIFVWENPNDSWAIVNVESSLVLNGACDEFEAGGWLSGSVSNLNVVASLKVWEWWNQPPTSPYPQATQTRPVLFLSADGGGFLSGLGGGTVKSASVGGTFDLSRSLFLLPPHGVAVFESTLTFTYENYDGGMIQVNFASGAFDVMCPAVVIAILS
jgi:hypothetical protein